MKTLFKYSIFCLLILSGCSTIYKNSIYKGNYNGREIILNFKDAKKGQILVDNNDSIPFTYEIEKNKIDNGSTKKMNIYVYRFTIDAKYKLDFPIGLYEIGKKRGNVLQINDSIIFVRQ